MKFEKTVLSAFFPIPEKNMKTGVSQSLDMWRSTGRQDIFFGEGKCITYAVWSLLILFTSWTTGKWTYLFPESGFQTLQLLPLSLYAPHLEAGWAGIKKKVQMNKTEMHWNSMTPSGTSQLLFPSDLPPRESPSVTSY